MSETIVWTSMVEILEKDEDTLTAVGDAWVQ